jgi:Tol biopolymer transport system component
VTHNGFDVEPVFSPNGNQIAFARIVVDDPIATEAIYVVNTDGTGLRRVVPPMFGLEHPKWSPDGRWIAFNIAPEAGSTPNAGSVLLVHPDGTGMHVLRAATSDFGFFKPRWSPDGKWFLSGCFDRRVGRDRLCNFKSDGSGQIRIVPVADTEGVNVPAWGARRPHSR